MLNVGERTVRAAREVMQVRMDRHLPPRCTSMGLRLSQLLEAESESAVIDRAS